MNHQTSDTAHLAWDENWKTDDGRRDWLIPENDVVEWATKLRLSGYAKALDLGCGVGRHALALAALGYETAALDASPAGLEAMQQVCAERGLTIDAHLGKMTELPFADGSLDYVLSWNVIYHGDRNVVERTLSEIARVLRPGGVFQGTMLSKRRHDYGLGQEISTNTFVNPEAGGDKSHPHFFCSAAEFLELAQAFEIFELKDVDGQNRKTGSWHWYFAAEKR